MRKVFLGEFQHTLDNQRRIAIPKEWRSGGDEPQLFYLLPGRENGIKVMPKDYFMETVFEPLKKVSVAEKNRMLTQIGRHGHECVCDKQGRINLTTDLLQHAGLEASEPAQLLGSVHHFEIRRPEAQASGIEQFLDLLEAVQGGGASEE